MSPQRREDGTRLDEEASSPEPRAQLGLESCPHPREGSGEPGQAWAQCPPLSSSPESDVDGAGEWL